MCLLSTCIGLWSIDAVYKYKELEDYDVTLASIAQAIRTFLWVVLLIFPLIQVNV